LAIRQEHFPPNRGDPIFRAARKLSVCLFFVIIELIRKKQLNGLFDSVAGGDHRVTLSPLWDQLLYEFY
jgi:hypothetical protein